MPRKTRCDSVTVPFTVAIDTREQTPFTFQGLLADAADDRKPLIVPTQLKTLPSGDYSICGLEDRITLERKSLPDLYRSLTADRDRFEREMVRLQAYEVSCVVVEADWYEVMEHPPPHTTVKPKIIVRTVISWQQRYPRTHWWFLPGRPVAERIAFRVLERFARGKTDGDRGRLAGIDEASPGLD